jgi:hypothetical protein
MLLDDEAGKVRLVLGVGATEGGLIGDRVERLGDVALERDLTGLDRLEGSFGSTVRVGVAPTFSARTALTGL